MGGHEGWDSELFVEAPDEADLCGICCEVLEDAVETQCGHTFCDKCIRGWLKQREVCPQDQNPLTWGDCRPMVRDRRRILGLRVKCPFDDCGEEMELRQLRGHQKLCEHKPPDWVDPRDGLVPLDDEELPLTPIKQNADDDKVSPHKEAEPEFVIELNPDAVEEIKGGPDHAAERERLAKEQEEKDHAFAAQMQRDEQQRVARAKSAAKQPAQQQRAAWGEPAVYRPQPLELAPAQEDGAPYQEIGYQAEGRPEGIGAGVDGAEILRPPKKTRCCNDKIWCCVCCVFWIAILAIGAFILVSGGISQAKNNVGL